MVGDVRLTLVDDAGAERAVYAVRRRAARTPAEMADLMGDLSDAVDMVCTGVAVRSARAGRVPFQLLTA